MIGNLTYDEVEQIITIITNSNTNLKTILETMKQFPNEINSTDKMLRFSAEIDKFIEQLQENITLNKDADKVIAELKNDIN